MNIDIRLIPVVVLIAGLLAGVASASDTGKEKRWADQVVDAIMTGEAQWLMAGKQKFLGIYTEPAADKVLGGVIVAHGVGVHPNWTDIVQPLRTRLPEQGWHTLALQMPILSNEAKLEEYASVFPEVAPRIDAGIAFLQQKGVKNIVIIGHSLGSAMVAHYMATHPGADIKALVSVGATGSHFKAPKFNYIESLKKIKKPILDVAGSEDSEDVIKTEKLKAQTAREAGANYRLVKVEGANHFFVGKEDQLIREVGSWIKQFGS